MHKYKKDQFYIDAFAHFIKKFECAVHRIKHKGYKISHRINNVAASNHSYKIKGLPKITGASYGDNCWFLDYGGKNVNELGIHPFAIMMEGKYTITHDIIADVQQMYDFPIMTMTNGFMEGFGYYPEYRDCYTGTSDYHWCVGAAFTLGRHLLNKHWGPEHPTKVKLNYELDKKLLGVI